MTAPRLLLPAVVLLATLGCNESSQDTMTAAETTRPFAAFDLSGKILGPVSSDDDADMEITLRETRGVAADINFVRLTCSNRSTQEWGAATFVDERGTNRIEGSTTLVFIRHYRCPVSGRPAQIVVDLTDANGNHVWVNAAPFHPDWPGA